MFYMGDISRIAKVVIKCWCQHTVLACGSEYDKRIYLEVLPSIVGCAYSSL